MFNSAQPNGSQKRDSKSWANTVLWSNNLLHTANPGILLQYKNTTKYVKSIIRVLMLNFEHWTCVNLFTHSDTQTTNWSLSRATMWMNSTYAFSLMIYVYIHILTLLHILSSFWFPFMFLPLYFIRILCMSTVMWLYFYDLQSIVIHKQMMMVEYFICAVGYWWRGTGGYASAIKNFYASWNNKKIRNEKKSLFDEQTKCMNNKTRRIR